MRIEGSSRIRDAYRDSDVAAGYLDSRFAQPLGALLHSRQVGVMRRLLEGRRPLPRVLEIAPGPARLGVAVAPWLGRSGVMLDASLEMLALARTRLTEAGTQGSWSLVLGDAFSLALRPGFDLVASFRFIRHLGAEDRVRVYREVARVLNPGGRFVFDAVNETVSAPLRARAPRESYPVFDWLTRPDRLRAELGAAGFELLELAKVQRRYRALRLLQVLVAPRSRRLARVAMEVVERVGGGEPLEWVVTCAPV